MRLGVLVRATADLNQTLAFARREFNKTSHLVGHTPAYIHLHPACDLARAGDVIDGLPVVANPDVPPNCLRLTTVSLPDDETDNELNRERASAARQIEAMTRNLTAASQTPAA